MSKSEKCGLLVIYLTVLLQLGSIGCHAQFVVDVLKVSSHGEEELVQKCIATGGNFGKDLSDFILTDENFGCATPVEPVDACSPVRVPLNHTVTCQNPFAVVSRSDHAHPCKFSQQAYNVQNSSTPFKLVLFYNFPGADPITMEGSDARELVDLPVIMISYNCMEEILVQYPDSHLFRLRIRIDPGYYELIRYLIPFLVVICFCFALFLVTLCIRGCVERRKLNKRRLSKRNLKKIPVKKYRPGDEPDTCAICLEDFCPGEKLRHLPCRHVFHCKCIDVWLTQTRKVCPLCKRKIGSDSDSDGSTEDLRIPQPQQPATSTSDVSVETMQVVSLSAPSTSRAGAFWSSQEALVDHEIVFAEQNRKNVGVGGFLREAIRKLRSNTAETDEESGVGMENDVFHDQQQSLSSDDSDHLLEHEEASFASNEESTQSDSCDSSSAGSNTLSETTLMTMTSENLEEYEYH